MEQFYELVILNNKTLDEEKWFFKKLGNAQEFVCKRLYLPYIDWIERNFHSCNECYIYKQDNISYEINVFSFED